MLCVDVNVLVYAHRADTSEHAGYAQRLTELANGSEPLGLCDAVLSGFVRITTSRRIFNQPSDPDAAWRQVTALLEAPAAIFLRPGGRHWDHFSALCTEVNARGNDVADAYLAAFAIENNATWLSADRGFARFPGVRWRHPLETT